MPGEAIIIKGKKKSVFFRHSQRASSRRGESQSLSDLRGLFLRVPGDGSGRDGSAQVFAHGGPGDG